MFFRSSPVAIGKMRILTSQTRVQKKVLKIHINNIPKPFVESDDVFIKHTYEKTEGVEGVEGKYDIIKCKKRGD